MAPNATSALSSSRPFRARLSQATSARKAGANISRRETESPNRASGAIFWNTEIDMPLDQISQAHFLRSRKIIRTNIESLRGFLLHTMRKESAAPRP
jgi:hypothetical protein